MTNGIFLLLGSNLGDRRSVLSEARQQIADKIGPVVASSSLYETAAWGKTDQPAFYNQVVEVTSPLSARELLSQIHSIEKAFGRVRKEKWGARIVDIDVLYYGDAIVKAPDLQIPHPGIPERRFTLVPLVEIAPDFLHPLLKMTNRQLLEKCRDDLEVSLVEGI